MIGPHNVWVRFVRILWPEQEQVIVRTWGRLVSRWPVWPRPRLNNSHLSDNSLHLTDCQIFLKINLFQISADFASHFTFKLTLTWEKSLQSHALLWVVESELGLMPRKLDNTSAKMFSSPNQDHSSDLREQWL